MQLPLWHEPVHVSHEALVMMSLGLMHHLMHDEIFETLQQFPGQFDA
jgi:hypothetical protein